MRLPVHAPLWSCKAALAALVALLLLEGGLGIPGTVGGLGRRGLRANGLKVLEDGVILKSQASLVSSNAAPWTGELRQWEREVADRLVT